MPEENVATTPAAEPAATPDVSTQVAQNLWNENYVQPTQQATPTTTPTGQQPAAQTPAVEQPKPEETVIEANEYLKQQLGFDNWDAAKAEIEKWRQQPAPVATKDFSEIIKEKEDDLYNYYNTKRQLDRLEKLPIANTNEASEVIKSSLQYKNKNLTTDEIDFLFQETYNKPSKPTQQMDEEDTVYQFRVSEWEQQVQRIDRKMMIDAKLAQPELANHKSQIVAPDIPKVEIPQAQPSQEDLAKVEAFRTNFNQKLESDYKNFSGFSVKAIDGGVEIPISYVISPEELDASKKLVAGFNMNEFFDSRWFDEKGNPKVNTIQEDLYLLQNRDNIFQKIANEASAKRFDHYLKTKSNVQVNGPSGAAPVNTEKTPNQKLAETVWSMQ